MALNWPFPYPYNLPSLGVLSQSVRRAALEQEAAARRSAAGAACSAKSFIARQLSASSPSVSARWSVDSDRVPPAAAAASLAPPNHRYQ